MAASLPTPTPTDDLTTPRTAAAELERLTVAFLDALNEQDFDFKSEKAQEVVARFTPDWRCQIDTSAAGSPPVTLAEQVERWRWRAQECPDVHFQIVDIMSSVDEHKGIASVYIEMEVEGISNVKLQAMNEVKWRLVDDEWMCYYVIGLRGSRMNNGLGL